MKRTQQCPKCQGRKLWVVERFRVPGEYVGGAVMAVVQTQQEAGGFLGVGKLSPKGAFDLWVCESCGFSELWARDLSRLKEDPANGVRRIDTTPPEGGPFR